MELCCTGQWHKHFMLKDMHLTALQKELGVFNLSTRIGFVDNPFLCIENCREKEKYHYA